MTYILVILALVIGYVLGCVKTESDWWLWRFRQIDKVSQPPSKGTKEQ